MGSLLVGSWKERDGEKEKERAGRGVEERERERESERERARGGQQRRVSGGRAASHTPGPHLHRPLLLLLLLLRGDREQRGGSRGARAKSEMDVT